MAFLNLGIHEIALQCYGLGWGCVPILNSKITNKNETKLALSNPEKTLVSSMRAEIRQSVALFGFSWVCVRAVAHVFHRSVNVRE